MSSIAPRYVLKPDPHSSHSIVLRWLGQGRRRRVLDVGAADGILSRTLTARGWRVTAIEYVDRRILDHSHVRFSTERPLRAFVADAGLRIEWLLATPAPLYQVLPQRWHRGWLAATHSMSAAIARRLPRLLGYQFVVLARPKGGGSVAGG